MTWSVSLPTGFRPHRNLVIFTAKGLVPLGGVARVPTSAVVASTSVDAAVQACSPALESFEGWTDNGKYAVGVALRGGLVTEEVASCLREKQMPKLARPTGMSVREAIPGDEVDRYALAASILATSLDWRSLNSAESIFLSFQSMKVCWRSMKKARVASLSLKP